MIYNIVRFLDKYKFAIGISLMFLVGSLGSIYFEDNRKFDVYLLYDHKRYLTNILFDISNLFNFTVLTYFLSTYNKKVFKPLFYLSLFVWILYFAFYNQIGSLLSIPFYLFLVIYYNLNR